MKQQRQTSKFKAQVVLELLKGETLEELSRKYAVAVSEINTWRDEFIQNGPDGFKRKPVRSDGPIRTAVKSRFGTVGKGICDGIGLSLRLDHGSQYDSADFRKEMDFLDIEMSHAFVRSPECNGCVERFNRTIEEEVSVSAHL